MGAHDLPDYNDYRVSREVLQCFPKDILLIRLLYFHQNNLTCIKIKNNQIWVLCYLNQIGIWTYRDRSNPSRIDSTSQTNSSRLKHIIILRSSNLKYTFGISHCRSCNYHTIICSISMSTSCEHTQHYKKDTNISCVNFIGWYWL